jgi:tetraacyldisaccharide 4'-kinase
MLNTTLSHLYGAVVAARNRRFDAGKADVKRVAARVISVGNVSAGGTGKSPVVQMIARELATHGIRTAIVSRGYGRKSKGEVIVSDGRTIFTDAASAGDEPQMHAEWAVRSGLHVPVIVNKRKAAAAETAVTSFTTEAVVVDDGFQHRQLHRDCDVVLLDRATLVCPFLLPVGQLREPLTALRRADVICCMGGVSVEEAQAAVPHEYTAQALFVEIETRAAAPVIILGEVNVLKERLYAVSGIAHPHRFTCSLQTQGLTIADVKTFPDHHRYTQRDVDALLNAVLRLDCKAIISTEKDVVKLKHFAASFEQQNIALVVLPLECVIGSGIEDFHSILL